MMVMVIWFQASMVMVKRRNLRNFTLIPAALFCCCPESRVTGNTAAGGYTACASRPIWWGRGGEGKAH